MLLQIRVVGLILLHRHLVESVNVPSVLDGFDAIGHLELRGIMRRVVLDVVNQHWFMYLIHNYRLIFLSHSILNVVLFLQKTSLVVI